MKGQAKYTLRVPLASNVSNVNIVVKCCVDFVLQNDAPKYLADSHTKFESSEKEKEQG